MLRIFLFLLTNLAVLFVANISLRLLGVDTFFAQSGGLDLGSLLIFCAVFGMAGSVVSLLISKPIAKWSTRTKIIKQANSREEQWLLDTVAELAQKAGIGMPEVGVFPSPQANAFATGWNKNSALVAVSAGLLQDFQKEEIKAVMGHEIAHVANGDMVTLALIQGVLNTFVMFFARIIGYAIDKAVFRNERDGVGIGFYITTFVAEIALGILASMIVMAFSRYREFHADEGSAELYSPKAMIQALQRLQGEHEQAGALPQAMTAFGIRPGEPKGIMHLFSSHPPLEKRIQALQKKYG